MLFRSTIFYSFAELLGYSFEIIGKSFLKLQSFLKKIPASKWFNFKISFSICRGIKY